MAAFAALVALAQLLLPDRLLLQIWIAAATPWAYLPVWAVLAWGLWRRDRFVVAVAGLVALVHLGWLLPVVWGDESEEPADLRVATVNALAWSPAPERVAEEILALDADVVAVQELSFELAELLQGERFRVAYPHRSLLPHEDAFGMALLSRHPVDVRVTDLVGVPMMEATVRTPGGELELWAVHTVPPVDGDYAERWRHQSARLVERLGERTPDVLTGDLNATLFNRLPRQLTAMGFASAHAETGRGLATTFPVGRSMPPMLLDHVFVSDSLEVLRVREGEGRASDHRPVVADLAFR